MSAVTADGWYADPTGRHAERLWLSGVWTRRVRDADGIESTEGEDHSGAMTSAPAPRAVRHPAASTPGAVRGWSVERPSYGLATALLGAIIALLGYFVFDWSADLSFTDVRDTVRVDTGDFNVVSVAYFRLVYLPLLIDVLLTGLLVAVGRRPARFTVAAAGVFGGLGLIGVVIWIESGGVGTSVSRGDALPLLATMVAAGIIAAALGVGAYFDDTASLARGLAATLAGLAVVLHAFVVADLFNHGPDAAIGAWLPAIGYGLLAIAPVLPYRRILHT